MSLWTLLYYQIVTATTLFGVLMLYNFANYQSNSCSEWLE